MGACAPGDNCGLSAAPGARRHRRLADAFAHAFTHQICQDLARFARPDRILARPRFDLVGQEQPRFNPTRAERIRFDSTRRDSIQSDPIRSHPIGLAIQSGERAIQPNRSERASQPASASQAPQGLSGRRLASHAPVARSRERERESGSLCVAAGRAHLAGSIHAAHTGELIIGERHRRACERSAGPIAIADFRPASARADRARGTSGRGGAPPPPPSQPGEPPRLGGSRWPPTRPTWGRNVGAKYRPPLSSRRPRQEELAGAGGVAPSHSCRRLAFWPRACSPARRPRPRPLGSVRGRPNMRRSCARCFSRGQIQAAPAKVVAPDYTGGL